MLAQVVVIAGPSGSGKTRLADRLGVTVLNLDDFYRDSDDPANPQVRVSPDSSDLTVDWDHPNSWRRDESVTAIEHLCRHGRAEVPTYSISASRRTGQRELDLNGASIFVAEGIFAAEVVLECRDRGLLADALCVTQHPAVTFWRRLLRDLRERRKPPLMLLRRGLRLATEQRSVVARAVELGCAPVSADEGYRRVQTLRSAQ